MSYESNKIEVLDLFDNHIIKYVVKDLEVLDSIEPDASGAGACTIPQAISTFAALDLIGYLVHSQNVRPVDMCFTELINNNTYFPEFKQYSSFFSVRLLLQNESPTMMNQHYRNLNSIISKLNSQRTKSIARTKKFSYIFMYIDTFKNYISTIQFYFLFTHWKIKCGIKKYYCLI